MIAIIVDIIGIVVKAYAIEAVANAKALLGYFYLINVPTFVLSLLLSWSSDLTFGRDKMSEVDTQPNRMVRYLAAAGVVGPVGYTVTWLILGFLEPTYSHTRDPISNLSAIGAPYSPVMTYIIFVFALLIIVFAYGLHRGLASGFWAGPVVLAIAGLGYVGIALAPLNLADTGDPNVPHTISASVTVFALMIAPILLFPRLRRDPGWQNLSGYSIVTTVVAFAFAVLASLPAFAGWEGLMQRLVLEVVLVWMIVIAIRLYARTRP